MWNVDSHKSGASVNGKELKDDEMQRITNQNDFFLSCFLLKLFKK